MKISETLSYTFQKKSDYVLEFVKITNKHDL